MNVKRFFFLLVVALATVSFAVATGQSDSGTSDAGYTFTPRGSLPIVEGSGAVVSLFTHGDLDRDYAKNYYLEWFTPIANVELDLRLVTTDQYKEKLNLLFAAGDAPDIVSPNNNSLTYWSTGEQMNALDQGLILPIEDLIKEHSENFIKFLNSPEYPGLREAITAPGGHITGFPDIGTCYHCFFSQKMNVNQVWLDNLGLDYPETPEEFKQMLIAFRDQDANGNGDTSDEIPLAFAKAGAMVQLDGFLMSPWEYSPAYFDRLAIDDKGIIYAAYTTDAYREGLKYLKELWDENLIYKESFVQDRNLLKQLNSVTEINDPQTLGAVPAMHRGYFITGDAGAERWREWIAIPPLKNAYGERLAINYKSQYQYNPGYKAFITADAKDPVLAFRYIDAQWDGIFDNGDAYQINQLAQMGPLGVTWFKPDPGAKGYDGLGAWAKRGDPLPEDHQYYNNATFPVLAGPIRHSGYQVDAGMTWKDDHPSAYEQYLWVVTNDNYAPYAQDMKKVVPQLFIAPEKAQEASQYEAQIKSFVEENIASFVSGSKDVFNDGDWEKYKSQLDRLGLQQYLQLKQEALDAMRN
jgi:putative aldouronate transport system substrate-binding protein